MEDAIARLIIRIRELEGELETELKAKRDKFRYRLEGKRVIFEKEIRVRHRALRMGLLRFLRESKFATIATAPVIYSLVVPFGLLDLMVALYQLICFPVYGIPRVPRARYVVIDRHRLAYLNGIEKLNCVYCGYANGVIAWVRAVAARTEQYWCPIKHARPAQPHDRYPEFLDYGDGEGYHERLDEQRRRAAEE